MDKFTKKYPNIIELLKGTKGRYYFRIKSKNGNILAHSELYNSRQAALKAIKSLMSKPLTLWEKK